VHAHMHTHTHTQARMCTCSRTRMSLQEWLFMLVRKPMLVIVPVCVFIVITALCLFGEYLVTLGQVIKSFISTGFYLLSLNFGRGALWQTESLMICRAS